MRRARMHLGLAAAGLVIGAPVAVVFQGARAFPATFWRKEDVVPAQEWIAGGHRSTVLIPVAEDALLGRWRRRAPRTVWLRVSKLLRNTVKPETTPSFLRPVEYVVSARPAWDVFEMRRTERGLLMGTQDHGD